MRGGWFVICFLLSLLGAGSITCCFAVGADEAKIAISQVEGDLGLAYVAVAEAAEAGADITDMLDKLVDAGVFLSAANNAFRIRDYTTAHEFAERCGEASPTLPDRGLRSGRRRGLVHPSQPPLLANCPLRREVS